MGSGSSAFCDIRLNTSLTDEQRAKFQDPRTIQRILRNTKTIAIVGLSTETVKASNMVASYLMDERYRVIPVNPRADEILGQKCYPDLKSIPEKIDVVDIFRPASEVASIVEGAIAIGAGAVWMQLKIIDLAAAERAAEAGLSVVVDRCIKMEHGRYSGNLHWAGMNTEVISARCSKSIAK